MNANEILDMIGDAKGTYLWETQKYRDGTAGVSGMSISRQARRTCSAACFTSRCRSRSPPACGRDC